MRFDHAPDGSWYAAVLFLDDDAHLMTEDDEGLRVSDEVRQFLDDLVGDWETDTLFTSVAIYFRNELHLVHFKLRFFEGRLTI